MQVSHMAMTRCFFALEAGFPEKKYLWVRIDARTAKPTMQSPAYIFTNNSQLSSIKFTTLVVSLDSHCPLPSNGVGLAVRIQIQGNCIE